jgi:hypothetical protein
MGTTRDDNQMGANHFEFWGSSSKRNSTNEN